MIFVIQLSIIGTCTTGKLGHLQWYWYLLLFSTCGLDYDAGMRPHLSFNFQVQEHAPMEGVGTTAVQVGQCEMNIFACSNRHGLSMWHKQVFLPRYDCLTRGLVPKAL